MRVPSLARPEMAARRGLKRRELHCCGWWVCGLRFGCLEEMVEGTSLKGFGRRKAHVFIS